MQDIHSLSGGGNPAAAARLFAAAGDRHLRPLHHPHHPNSQALKCPRCDSLNTKFCYYNNYNLSQPRHFCKSCRRYWTKGGVLRNVPVGGGCRKSRRCSSSGSSSSNSSSKPPAAKPKPHEDSDTTSSVAAVTTANTTVNNSNNNLSSSDSSTLTAAAAAELPSLFQEYGSSCLEKPSMYGRLDVGLEMGNFDGMMGSTVEMEMTPFGYAGVLTQHDDPQQQQQQRQQGMEVVEGFRTLDWPGGEENDGGGLFEVTGAVVDRGYWSQQQNQWTASDVDADQHRRHHHHHQPQQQGRGGLFLP